MVTWFFVEILGIAFTITVKALPADRRPKHIDPEGETDVRTRIGREKRRFPAPSCGIGARCFVALKANEAGFAAACRCCLRRDQAIVSRGGLARRVSASVSRLCGHGAIGPSRVRAGSVGRAGGDDPFAGLAGDGGDAVEVGVVVEHAQVTGLGGGGDQEVGHLAAALVPGGEQPLHLQCSADVVAGRLDQLEHLQGLYEAIPLGCAARRVADLEVADPSSRELAPGGFRLDRRPDRRLTEAREHARIDEMRQRHASSRAASWARASRSSDRFTRAESPPPAWRSARLTVSLIVWVPSSARAARRASSSMSIRCFATRAVYTSRDRYRSGRARRSNCASTRRSGSRAPRRTAPQS